MKLRFGEADFASVTTKRGNAFAQSPNQQLHRKTVIPKRARRERGVAIVRSRRA